MPGGGESENCTMAEREISRGHPPCWQLARFSPLRTTHAYHHWHIQSTEAMATMQQAPFPSRHRSQLCFCFVSELFFCPVAFCSVQSLRATTNHASLASFGVCPVSLSFASMHATPRPKTRIFRRVAVDCTIFGSY